MKVLLVHNHYRVTGGAEVFVHEIERILKSRGHEVAYFSCSDEGEGSPWATFYPEAVDYSRLTLGTLARFPRMVYSGKVRDAVQAIVDSFKPDIAHCFAVYTRLTPAVLDGLRGRNVPIVCSFNDYKHICPNYKLFHHGRLCEDCRGRRFYHAILNRCSHDSRPSSIAKAIEAYVHRWMNIYRRNIHTFLFASEFMARKTEAFWGPGTFRWKMLRNPFDGTRSPAPREPGDFALFFGRLIEEKGVDILLRAMLLVPDARLKIVGDGPQEAGLKRLAGDLDLRNVEFLGPKWGADMDDLLVRSRFTIVPSRWHENFPYVILQSFAAGKAVIGSDRGGIPELVEQGTRGLIYDAEDPAALAAAIRSLWDGPERCAHMGRNAKTYCEREFNDDRFYKDLIAIYDEVLR